jgi:hypothetical protein
MPVTVAFHDDYRWSSRQPFHLRRTAWYSTGCGKG